MAVRGRKPKPYLQAVREGDTGHRQAKEGMVLPPTDLTEPDWTVFFPGRKVAMVRARKTSARLWSVLAPTLTRSAGLVREQQETLVEYCITYARIEQGERALSMEGVVVTTERGQVKNAWTTVLNGYRSHLRSLIGELGLSPSAATRITRPNSGDDEEDPFD